jgi:tetratricopeptide (TPR) repeat protein
MQGRKIILPVLIILFATSAAFCQSEGLKTVVNNLAFYKQKKDLKYLGNAKKMVDSIVDAAPDSLDLERNVYKAVVYSSILYIDSLNKLKQSAAFFSQTTGLVDRLSANRKIYKFQVDIDYAKNCLANVYIRKAFVYINNSDFGNALTLFEGAQKYAPSFKQLNAYIAFSNNKLGNLRAAAKYYTDLIGGDSTKAEYVEAASIIYKSFGDTVTALAIVKKGRKVLPNDKSLLLDEANIYNNRKDYRSLVNLLPALLEINTNNADIAFVAANCYDHLNQYDKAESLYLHAIELNSSAYDPIFDLGLLYFKHSEIKREGSNAQNTALAVQWLEKANEIAPNEVNCLRVLQMVYAQTGNKDQVNRINDKLKQLTNQ